jgi:hypothetical protein
MTSISVIGDLHGYFDRYAELLQEDGLIDSSHNWIGNDRQLWLIGDLFDRGPNGLECLSLTMDLQSQARDCGGEVQCILGNHEMMILCAYRMQQISTDLGARVKAQWLQWGGVDSDLSDLTEQQADWLAELPAMHLLNDYLLIHADALVYITLGSTLQKVNEAFTSVANSTDLDEWIQLLNGFSQHRAFSELDKTGTQRAQSILRCFGGRQIIHGHTPISQVTNIAPEAVTEAFIYANDLCINIDGGIYLGSPGFVHHI